jgi:hypothetical protein
MRIETTTELARPGVIARGLEELEAAAAGDTGHPGDLAAPAPLAFLFRLHLTQLLRRGPGAGGEGEAVGRLLGLADAVAVRGAVPLTLPAELRRGLAQVGAGLRKAGAWREDAPFWWQPLPSAGPAEDLAREVEQAVTLPAADDLAEFSRQPWWRSTHLLSPDVAARIHDELETAHEALGLEAGEVGRGHLDDRRSDRVRYVSGHEPELLDRAPRAAALVQLLLARLAGSLKPVGNLTAPQRAMLARYPAPSRGFDPHLDNPGAGHGFEDNGRALTLVLYLNDPNRPPEGGEIALWRPDDRRPEDEQPEPAGGVEKTPVLVQPARGGSGVLFDSRRVPHQVRPLRSGPARWALTVWLQDAVRGREPGWKPPLPRPTVSEVLAAVPDPPVPPGRVLLHRLEEHPRGPRIAVESVEVKGAELPRCGLVATVYDAGEELIPWARHHLDAGFDHLLVVFDRPEEPAEAELVTKLRDALPAERLTVWTAGEARERWPDPQETAEAVGLHRLAGLGPAPYAHAARQTLNATAALVAARAGEPGGRLDWLLHLDADEWFHLQGAGRGGAGVPEHFATLGVAGLDQVTYLDHELLRPHPPDGPARYKLNPRLAAARLGAAGWRALVDRLAMAQGAERPWFAAYWNGKSAARVAAARAAAGVHRWEMEEEVEGRHAVLAGPVVLHHHLPTAESFRRKYERALSGPEDPERPFPASPLEAAARRVLEAGGDLDELYRRHTEFSEREIELLEEAGTVLAIP